MKKKVEVLESPNCIDEYSLFGNILCIAEEKNFSYAD